jgi:hypothetical protein
MGVVGIHRRAEHAAARRGAQIERIEETAQVDEERVGHRPGKRPDAVQQRKDALLVELVVLWHGARPDVGGHRVQGLPVGQVFPVAVGDHGDGIVLAQAQALGARTVQGGDRRNAGQGAHEARKHARLADLRLEADLEGDVRHPVVIVVDLHLIENSRIERKVVGAVGRLQEGIDIERQNHAIRVLRAHKGEPVGDIGLLVQCRNRRLAVTGREDRWCGNCEHSRQNGNGCAQSCRRETHGNSPRWFWFFWIREEVDLHSDLRCAGRG